VGRLSEACGGVPALGGASGVVDPFEVMVCCDVAAECELTPSAGFAGAMTTCARRTTTIRRTTAITTRLLGINTAFLALLIIMSNSIYLRVRHRTHSTGAKKTLKGT
jgi:hypothetical protein